VSDRTLRQRLVPEIGDEGQARIARTVVELDAEGLTGEICARYLEHAGFAEVRAVPTTTRRPSALTQALALDVLAGADPAVLSVALGAALAVDHIRRASLGES
jgi:hypothetical protein